MRRDGIEYLLSKNYMHLRLIEWDCTLWSEIGFVTNQKLVDVLRSISGWPLKLLRLKKANEPRYSSSIIKDYGFAIRWILASTLFWPVNFVQPLFHVVEALQISSVVNHNNAVSAPVITRRDGTESLLPSSIPLWLYWRKTHKIFEKWKIIYCIRKLLTIWSFTVLASRSIVRIFWSEIYFRKLISSWMFVNLGRPRISCDGSIYWRNLRSRHRLLRYSFQCKCHQRIEEADTIYQHQNRQWARAWRGNRCIIENVTDIFRNWMTMWVQFSYGVICDQKCGQETHYSACMILEIQSWKGILEKLSNLIMLSNLPTKITFEDGNLAQGNECPYAVVVLEWFIEHRTRTV